MTELPSSVTEQYFKQIVYDETSGQLSLLDPSNKSFECNIYGNPKTKFNCLITGKANFSERKERNLIRSLILNYDKRLYHPQNRCFEGYSQFPRPLSQPFSNDLSNRTLLHKSLVENKRLILPKNAHLLQVMKNQGLSYLSSSIPSEDESNKDMIYKLINSTCREYDTQEELNQKHNYSHAQISAIKKFKKVLMVNSKNKVHGRKLTQPTELAKQQFQTIVELFSNRPNEKIALKNRLMKINASMPSIHFEENVFDKAKRVEMKEVNKSIDALYTVYKEKEGVNGLKVKEERCLMRRCKEERRLLSGYKRPIMKEKGIIQKALPKLPTRGDHYQRELEVIAMVNPFVIKEEMRRNASDKYIFEKKRKIKMGAMNNKNSK